MRHVLYGGSPVNPEVLGTARTLLGPVLVQYYGMAEVTGCITVMRADEHRPLRTTSSNIGSCGRVRTGMELTIHDETGRPVPAGTHGEICVAGPAVFAGYLRNDEANRNAFRDGWFRTGDIGMLDDEGFLYITGRQSDMFISGGSNVYPRETEEALLHHPAISDAAVVGLPDAKWGEIGGAVC